jgi:DNA modification methylase
VARVAGSADDELERVPDPPKEPKTKRGDVWVCGDHLLLCGDSLEAETEAWIEKGTTACVLTDPPYAIYGSSSGVGSDVADDKMIRPFFAALGRRMRHALRLFGHGYVFCDWRSWDAVLAGMKASTLAAKNCIVWDKGDFGLGSMYRNCHEFVGFFVSQPERSSHYAKQATGQRMVTQPNVRRVNRTGQGGFESEHEPGQRFHNAAKPVQLLQWLLDNSTDEGDLVLDLFGGSGSTMLACERSKRRCRMVEVEPKWCDVIVARWEQLTVRKAERKPAK